MNPKDKNVIHVSIDRFCGVKPKENRTLIFETHLHKAAIKQRLQFAWQLLVRKPIHLVLSDSMLKYGDRAVKEIEL